MAQIGETLKNERTNRGLTLADVHEATKISIQNLAALEEERFDSFANKVYARAFLRDYANFLGLDSGKLLQQYEEEWGKPPTPPEPIRRRRSPALAIAAVLALVIATGGFYVSREKLGPLINGHSSPVPAPKPDAIRMTGPPAPPKPIQPAPTSAQPQKQERTDFLNVRIAAFQLSWIRVNLDGKMVYQGTLRPGESKEWRAKESLRLRTGNAGGLQITINGQRQPPLGASGQIAERTWTRNMSERSTGKAE